MPERRVIKAATVQAAPIFFNLEECLKKAETYVAQASGQGCDIVAFGESWFPGYPFHIWLGPPAWAMQYAAQYFDNSVELGSPEFATLCDIARRHAIFISAGISERQGGSLFLSQCLIDRSGEVSCVRRKLKPTHVERSVFGEGYGEDLAVVATDIGNVGQLCCWEHIQPLSKYALYSQNEQIHVAAWPSFVVYKGKAYALGAEVNMAATRTYAVEGQCFVLAATSVIDRAALDFFKVGSEVPALIELGGGSSMIFGPDGRQLADFLPETEAGLVVAELDLDQIKAAKAIADPAGHYSKPEATRLLLSKRPLRPVVIDEATEAETEPDGALSVEAGNE